MGDPSVKDQVVTYVSVSCVIIVAILICIFGGGTLTKCIKLWKDFFADICSGCSSCCCKCNKTTPAASSSSEKQQSHHHPFPFVQNPLFSHYGFPGSYLITFQPGPAAPLPHQEYTVHHSASTPAPIPTVPTPVPHTDRESGVISLSESSA